MLRILIVDDEELIRMGIASKLRKSPFDIAEIGHAGNAAEALQAVARMNPHIVLCDISMDGPDGLHLSRQLAVMRPELKIIIISGYNEFSYAQQAIQIGVVDYLLKPVETALLNESLQKCVDSIEERHKSSKALSIVEHGMLQKRLRAYASDYLDGRVSDPGVLFSGYVPGSSSFSALYVYLDQSFYLFFDSFMEDIVRHLPAAEPGRNLVYFEYRHNEYLIALCAGPGDDGSQLAELPPAVSQALLTEHPKCTSSLYAIGIGGPCDDLRLAVSQAVTAMKHRVFFPGRALIRYSETVKHTAPYRADLSGLSVLRLAVQKQEAKKMMDVLDYWGRDLERKGYSYDSLQSLYFRLLILLDELGEDNPTFRRMHYPKEIYFFSSAWDVLDFFKDALLEMIQVSANASLTDDHRRKTIQKVRDYVDGNYAQEVSLKDISDRIPINYCYLSILFKETMNINFRDYVIQVRIDHAKQFLSDKYKVKDVAVLTGFSNQHYFSKAFKKATGLTPREYRELRR